MADRVRQFASLATGIAVVSSLLGGLAAWQAVGEITAHRERERAAVAIPTSRSEMIRRAADVAERAPEQAVVLYEVALATSPTREDRFSAQLGLARAYELLGDTDQAREALRTALVSSTKPSDPAELLETGKQAFRAGALREARRLFSAVLALEDRRPAAASSIFAEAAMGIGDSLYDEANGERSQLPEPGSVGSWTAFLSDVDRDAQPSATVRSTVQGLMATLQAERADARLILELLAGQAGLELDLPESWSAFSQVAVTASLRERPVERVLTTVAGVAGLEVFPDGEGRFRLEISPHRIDQPGRNRARELAAEAYQVALERKGADAPHAHLLLAEMDRIAERHQEAIGRYRALIAKWPQAPEVPLALMGLGRSELALLRFARARDALLRLINETDERELAPEAFLLIGQSYLAEGRDGDTEKTLRHLLRSFPEAVQAGRGRLLLGNVLRDTLKHKEALEVFLDAHRTSQNQELRAEAGLEAGRALLELGQARAAVGHLSRLVASDLGVWTADAYLLLGQAFHDAGDHLAALFALRHVSREHGQVVAGRTAEGLIPRETLESGLLEQSEAALTRALAAGVDPASEWLLPLAAAWLAAGEPRRALAVLRLPAAQAVIDPNSVPAVLLRARCNATLDPRACLRTLRAVEDRKLNDEQRREVARLAGDAQMALGRHDLALESYRTGRIRPEDVR